MQSFKLLPTIIYLTIVIAVGLICVHPHSTYAQTCGGTPSCTAQGYSDQTNAEYCRHDTTLDNYCMSPSSDQIYCHYCNPYTDYNNGYTCRYSLYSNSCSSCVDDDLMCSASNEYNGYAYEVGGWGKPGYLTYVSCNTAVSIYPVPLQQYGCSSNTDQKWCGSGCTTYCNSGKVYGSCNGLSEPYNTCGTAYGSQTCTYTQPQSCTNSSCGTFTCSDTYNNCDAGLGYSCPGSGTCTKTMGGKVTDSETGNPIANVYVNSTHGFDTTDSSGNYRIGGFPYNTGFTFDPTNLNTPCTSGYLCSGTGPTSPNPAKITGTVGGSGDCGTNCNFTYTPGHIAGHVYIDYNHNGVKDAEDVPIANVTLSATNPNKTDTTDATGAYDLSYLNDGAHTVTITVPAGYQIVGSTTQNITIGPNNYGVNFFITPLYGLTGLIYNDLDSGKCYNPSKITDPNFVKCTDKSITPNVDHGPGIDTAYDASQTTVTVVGDGQTRTLNQSDGTYSTGQVLRSGTYTVTLTTVPTDYHMTYPKNGVPAYFSNINIGTPGKSYACDTNNANDAVCDGSGNMSTLNFGMNNENVGGGGICTDVRDETSTQQFIPDTRSCGVLTGKYYIYGNSSCQTGPGIYSSGTITPDFGHGTASANNWIAGGATAESFSPVNPGVIRTSNSYLETTLTQNAITPTDLSTVCTPSTCYLPDNLPSGVYSYPFDTTFVGTKVSGGGTVDGTYTFPTGKNYVFITGDSTHQSNMTFKSAMLVPNGSTATFVTSKDMYVDPSVGESDITSTKGDLEGFYSADESFIIESDYTADNRCTDTGGTKDLRLNIIGSVVVNAAGNGGSFTNDRDLCAGDLTCPTYTTGLGDGGDNGSGDTVGTNLGLTYLLNAPDLIKHKNTFWQELAP